MFYSCNLDTNYCFQIVGVKRTKAGGQDVELNIRKRSADIVQISKLAILCLWVWFIILVFFIKDPKNTAREIDRFF